MAAAQSEFLGRVPAQSEFQGRVAGQSEAQENRQRRARIKEERNQEEKFNNKVQTKMESTGIKRRTLDAAYKAMHPWV